ncbi:MAG: hypothetical protein MRQ07_04975 [Candidatus Midichloria sp.]|nr:hypothetical protein [Candidatus Midichloria sp.]
MAQANALIYSMFIDIKNFTSSNSRDMALPNIYGKSRAKHPQGFAIALCD